MGQRMRVCVVLFAAVLGCGPSTSKPVISQIDPNDPRMNAAIAKARATVQEFIAVLKAPKPSYYGFSVKLAFTDGDVTEHMWLMPITFDGTHFHGTVNNQPEKLTNVTLGQKVAIDPATITDWMYIDDLILVGGQTLRAVRDSLPVADRAEFDKSLPFIVE